MAWSATLNEMRRTTPTWLPRSVLIHLAHQTYGLSMRQIARELGIQPSTVSRSLERTSHKLADPLFALGVRRVSSTLPMQNQKSHNSMALPQAENHICRQTKQAATLLTKDKYRQDSKRFLQALNAPERCLIVSLELHKVVVAELTENESSSKGESFDRSLAEAFILNDLIKLKHHNKVLSYILTSAGRSYLEHYSGISAKKKSYLHSNFQKDTGQHRHQMKTPKTTNAHRLPCLPEKKSEMPILALARLQDKSGEAFLSPELVTAGRMLSEDFELSNLISSLENTEDPKPRRNPKQRLKNNSFLHTDPQAC